MTAKQIKKLVDLMVEVKRDYPERRSMPQPIHSAPWYEALQNRLGKIKDMPLPEDMETLVDTINDFLDN